ncbi:MAG: recombinase family protein [Clostridiales bacterium]|nr:recombinase family protein [Clostridiales bacterium]
MDLIGYYRGAENCGLRARMNEYADKHGFELVLVLHDKEGEYGAWRQLQNLVKLEECNIVLLPSFDALGDDKYIRLENRLFLERNAVKTLYAEPPNIDFRHDLIVAAKRFSGFVADWDASYGLMLPYPDNFRPFKRVPPFGYRIENGEAVVSEPEAELVRRIFECYIAGKKIIEICREAEGFSSNKGMKFGNMTVKTILRNERYLGRISLKGYHLEPIITFGTWLKARERLEKEYPLVKPMTPFIDRIRSDKRLSFIRNDGDIELGFRKDRAKSGYCIDLDALENEICAAVGRHANARSALSSLVTYAENELHEAEEAYPKAVSENNRVIGRFHRRLDKLKNGDRSSKLQNELEAMTDLKNVYSMRVRRIGSEKELFSISKEDLHEFIERAARMSELSLEEKAFIARVFGVTLVIRNYEAFILAASPIDGRLKRFKLDNEIFE